MKPYSLLLVSLTKPTTPEAIRCSNHMIAYGLWSEFEKLPHVTLHHQGSDEPLASDTPCDFVLIHAYLGRPIYDELAAIRSNTRRKVMVILEIPHHSPLVDHSFLFLPIEHANSEQIRMPIIRTLLDASRRPTWPGSVLLDHVWLPFCGTERDWTERLHQWLAPVVDRHPVGQLKRGGYEAAEQFPPWVVSIPEAGYPDYLRATAEYETFILTHPGSYEHSIADMAARGIRVLVPVSNGKAFCHPSIIEDLKLETFRNGDELLSLLDGPKPPPLPPETFTDMPQVVGRIDAYCQEAMK